ncbi:MAG: leucine--tRNA ligase [Bdellovibrionia bacterium]
MAFPHLDFEKKWQDRWEKDGAFIAKQDSRPKYYVLDMFPYPSSQGLHVGHPEGYTATDIISRYKRTRGFNVLHPMGWDAFGLPAEQYAIQTGIHPAVTTQQALTTFRRQLKSFGFSFDWSREISTADPKYYKWTQFIFTKLYEKGLAYQKEVPVNWCPALKTVLANEEVIDGKSERGGHPVVRVPMKQWMLKITAYADRLLEGLDKIDWPERTKEGQRNWIGRSEGARVFFALDGFSDKLEIFTTRPDTIFGASFMVLAPEHPLVEKITTSAQKAEVKKYVEVATRRSEMERQVSTDKTGVATGAFALNPFTKQKIPVWIADYVLMGYGTGAIMAVPGHDTRDFEFAKMFGLQVTRVIEGGDLPYEGEGRMVNSGILDGGSSKDAIPKIIAEIAKQKLGEKTVQYKFRDWLFSRQRYWGEPFPVVRYPAKGISCLPADELPVLLPNVPDYEPSEKGESPLARIKDWVNYKSPKTGETGVRETDTMPGSAGSSWYFLRYADPHNENEPFSFESQKYWMPVDLYLGGPEHTVGHLLYSRFWHKVLFDAGLVSTDEPFQKLVHQGMILGEDGEKMSKSRGNVVNPDIVVEKYGADALRMFLMFMGPLDRDKPWSDTGIQGVHRFLDRVWRLCFAEEGGTVLLEDKPASSETEKVLHKTIKKVTEDIESLGFNTAISQMMILVNELYKTGERPRKLVQTLTQLLAPFAPHIAEEIWSRIGGQGLVSLTPWPSFDKSLATDNTATIAVQVNGKKRGTVELALDASEETAMSEARKIEPVQKALEGLKIQNIIYKAGKILSIMAK